MRCAPSPTCDDLACDALSFEDGARYNFEVAVTDASATTHLNVTVELTTPTGNTPPFIEDDPELVFSVREGLAIGSPVCMVANPSICGITAATQTEPHQEVIAFSLSSPLKHKGQVVIDPSTGLLTVGRVLDFEAHRLIELLVVAEDGGTRHPGVDQSLRAAARLAIEVVDVNEAPVALASETCVHVAIAHRHTMRPPESDFALALAVCAVFSLRAKPSPQTPKLAACSYTTTT